ncbi:uncharacterized protein LOC112846032 [Oreochromis niloticus]|uniref:uncharacterized protein LOC112846032 n=1 Tax=Oreochromis niloticus TaxID=8128 RepID=UPI000DF28DC5|nr:uncharacterized protein LOC112846032 [Oreochromis niloticus]
MSSDLAENIGRAVLSAIQRFSGSAPSTSQTPQHLESSNAPGPSRPAVSTGISYRSDGYQGRLQISKEELENVLSLKTSFTEAASILSISMPTLYKLLQDYNISVSKFNVISDHELDQIVSQIKTEHPNVGEVMLMGHLRSKNIVVQRWRVRESLRRVDSPGVLSRRRTAVARRVYSVPHPNFIWHIDGNHKLIRWKFVVHGAIDGYSRMLMFLQCSSNNRAETVKALFTAAVGQFGKPLHIRTDHGGENAQIWEEMRASRGYQ